MRKYMAAFLALMLTLVCLCVPAFATDTEPAQDAIKVTLPTALTVYDNGDGTYETSAASIINQGRANIVVSDISASAAEGWSLVDWGETTKHAVANSRYISAEFFGAGIDSSGHVTGAEYPAISGGGNYADLDYDFWMSPQTAPLDGVQVATAVVTIQLDGNGGLAGIEITNPPDVTDYVPGDDFDPTGMEVTAHYFDGSTADVTDLVELSNNTNLQDGQETVDVTYTEDNLTATAPVEITVQDLSVHVILYADGELVFQEGGTPEAGREVVATYDGIETWTGSSEAPWYSYHDSIQTVSFDTMVVPLSTTSWFRDCSNLTVINDIGNLDTSKVTSMNMMFYGCSSLAELDVSGFNTSSVTSMNGMFTGCSGLKSLNVSGFDTTDVGDMGNMFSNCSGLTALNLSDFDTANVTNMNGMFSGCTGLETLDVSGFITENVRDMSSMFYRCSSLTSLDLSSFYTGRVTNMNNMFQFCSALESVDVSTFDTSRVTDMNSMFANCTSLTELDLSSFATPNVQYMYTMFTQNSQLKTIYASSSFVTDSVTDGSFMFESCNSIVGGNGTRFSYVHIDEEYARVDDPNNGTPGYFTDKTAPFDVSVTNYAERFATYTEPSGGWVRGENTFTVTSTEPLVVGIIRNETMTELSCVNVGENTYQFTAELRNGDEIALAVIGDADLDGASRVTDASRIGGYVSGSYEFTKRECVQLLTADIDRDGDIDSDDSLQQRNRPIGLFTPSWNTAGAANPFKLTYYEYYLSHTDDYVPSAWVAGENTFTLQEPCHVTLTHAGETTDVPYTRVDDVLYQYTVDISSGDIISVYEPDPFEITVTNYSNTATYTEPVDGWVEGENVFAVSAPSAHSVGVIHNDTLTELSCISVGRDTYQFTADLQDGDEIIIVTTGDADLDGTVDMLDASRIAQSINGTYELTIAGQLAGDCDHNGRIDDSDASYISESFVDSSRLTWNLVGDSTISVTVTNYSNTATYTEPTDGWVSGENVFAVSAPTAHCVAVVRNETATELTCSALGDDTYQFTADLQDGDEIIIVALGDADLDGRVRAIDATRVANSLIGMYEFTGRECAQMLAADADRNGSIQAIDATRITQSMIGQYTLIWNGAGQSVDEPDPIDVSVVCTVDGITIEQDVFYEGGNFIDVFGAADTIDADTGESSLYDIYVMTSSGTTHGVSFIGVNVDDNTTVYSITFSAGDTLYIVPHASNSILEQPAEELPTDDMPAEDAGATEAPVETISVSLTNYAPETIHVEAPAEGWTAGESQFTVSCGQPFVAARLRDGHVSVLTRDTGAVSAELAEGDSLLFVLTGDVDLNGVVDNADSVRAQQYLSGAYQFSDSVAGELAMDADFNGSLDDTDAVAIDLYLSNLYQFGDEPYWLEDKTEPELPEEEAPVEEPESSIDETPAEEPVEETDQEQEVSEPVTDTPEQGETEDTAGPEQDAPEAPTEPETTPVEEPVEENQQEAPEQGAPAEAHEPVTADQAPEVAPAPAQE